MQHRNARLTPTGRLELVRLVLDDGKTFEEAAASSNVRSKSTVSTWVGRWRAASEEDRRTLACLQDRSSRPHSSPRMLAADEQQRICSERRRRGWGPRQIASLVGHPHSTVHACLKRHGCSRPERPEREPANRYEWPCPGDLLHLDVKTYARFERPGHAVTGDRSRPGEHRRRQLGNDHAHAAVDDHSRLAFAELFDDQRAASVVTFVEHALAFYRGQGMTVRRILTDNAWSYTHNRALAELLAGERIEHWTIRPYRARTNGKVERFHQTMAREWGYGLTYRSSEHRERALQHWLLYYNEQRRHSEIGDRPPISRVRNLPGQDS